MVVESARRVGALDVFEVTVAVEVGRALEPGERLAHVLLEPSDELPVARPALVLIEEDQEERGCVVRAVVRARDLAHGLEAAAAKLVDDLAGLGVGEVVPVGRLQLRERLQSRLRHLGLEGERLVLYPNPLPNKEAYRRLLADPPRELPRVGEHDYYYQRRSQRSRLIPP